MVFSKRMAPMIFSPEKEGVVIMRVRISCTISYMLSSPLTYFCKRNDGVGVGVRVSNYYYVLSSIFSLSFYNIKYQTHILWNTIRSQCLGGASTTLIQCRKETIGLAGFLHHVIKQSHYMLVYYLKPVLLSSGFLCVEPKQDLRFEWF
mmetsp:Transcript_19564/g.29622  ORF Transcript_19564/g.29622 Transcript_19564/m.29622 type:complete len:148 (+) Transcript_19564:499-942(+)